MREIRELLADPIPKPKKEKKKPQYKHVYVIISYDGNGNLIFDQTTHQDTAWGFAKSDYRLKYMRLNVPIRGN